MVLKLFVPGPVLNIIGILLNEQVNNLNIVNNVKNKGFQFWQKKVVSFVVKWGVNF